MALTTIATIDGTSNPKHTVTVQYELISYVGTELKIRIRSTYTVPEHGSVQMGALDSSDDNSIRPYVKFSIDQTNPIYYDRKELNFSGPKTEEEHDTTYTLDRSSNMGAFDLTISGRVRIASKEYNKGENHTWSAKVSIPAAGIVRIYTSSGWKNAIPYVYTSNGWKQTIPYVYTSNGWKIGQ